MNKVLAAVVLVGSCGLVHAEQSEQVIKNVAAKAAHMVFDIAERVNPVVRDSMLNFLASCTPEEKELFDKMIVCAIASANGVQPVHCVLLQQAWDRAHNDLMKSSEMQARRDALDAAYAEATDAVIAEMPEQTARMAREARDTLRALAAAAQDARMHKVS